MIALMDLIVDVIAILIHPFLAAGWLWICFNWSFPWVGYETKVKYRYCFLIVLIFDIIMVLIGKWLS